MTALSDLETLLEQAKEPSRVLNDQVRKCLQPDLLKDCWCTGACMKSDGVCVAVPPYTSSIDAAVQLVEAVLPGWDWTLETDDGAAYAGLNNGAISPDGVFLMREVWNPGQPALALCLAVCRAKLAMEQQP